MSKTPTKRPTDTVLVDILLSSNSRPQGRSDTSVLASLSRVTCPDDKSDDAGAYLLEIRALVGALTAGHNKPVRDVMKSHVLQKRDMFCGILPKG